MSEHPLQIVAGGQSGADRGALDAALAAGAPCGGWCPAGRRAEDGPIPERYPLTELPRGGFSARTRRNVEDSEGTLVVLLPGAGPGTRLTMQYAVARGKPLLVVDAAGEALDEAIDRAVRFVESCCIRILNVAGPRASEAPKAHAYTRQLVEGLLERTRAMQPGTVNE